jgi:hypothetical protein
MVCSILFMNFVPFLIGIRKLLTFSCNRAASGTCFLIWERSWFGAFIRIAI